MDPSAASSHSTSRVHDVVVVGSIIIDLTAYASRMPRPGESLVGNSFQQSYGGKGANQCMMAHYLGSRALMVGCLGDDELGKAYQRHLDAQGLHSVIKPPPPGSSTGVAQITVTQDGENFIIVVPGANNCLEREDILAPDSVIHSAVQQARVVVCQLEVPYPVVEATLALARRAGALTILNTAPMPADASTVPDSLFQLSDIVCANETEAAALCGLSIDGGISPWFLAERGLEKMRALGCPFPMVTMGSEGALFSDKQQRKLHVKADEVKAVDTTGAGDCFVGSLAHFLAIGAREGGDALTADCLTDAVRKACRLASVSVTRKGTQISFPRGEEAVKIVEETK